MDLSPTVSMNSQDMLIGAMNTKSSTETMKAEILLVFMNSLPHIERFSNDCRKTRIKAITPTNHNRNKQRHEPITIPSNYL